MRVAVLLALLLTLTGCDIYVATAGDAEEARLANEYLNAQLTDGDTTIVNWRPTKTHIELTVLEAVDADNRATAMAALRRKQAEEGWRTIEVIFNNGEVERLKEGT